MGPAVSYQKTVSEITKETITNVMVESSSRCKSGNVNTQTINISDINAVGCSIKINNISQQQSISTNFTCAQENDNQTELKNRMQNDLKKNLETSAKAGLGILTVSVSEDIQKTVDTITNNIDIKTMSECISENVNSQVQNIGKIKMRCKNSEELVISEISQNIISSSVSACIQSNKAIQSAINDLQNKLDTTIKTSATGMQISGSSIFMFFIFLVFLGVGAYYFTLEDDEKTSTKKKFISKFRKLRPKK